MADINKLPKDDRPGQAVRVADFMELHPEGVTTSQIKTACDPGCTTKLLSEMRKKLGYSIRKFHGAEACQGGTKQRPCDLFILVSRPINAQPDLFGTE